MKRCLILTIVVFLIIPISVDLQAVTIQFDTENRGPSDTLQIGGITISGDPTGSQVATAVGAGLGNSLIVPNYSLDSRLSFPAGSPDFYDYAAEQLIFTAPGSINSVTIVPYFSVLGPGESVKLPFDMLIVSEAGPHYTSIDASDPSPITFTLPNIFSIAPIGDVDPTTTFLGYLEEHGFPAVTFQYGFTITSLDYTVPEPSTIILLALGMIGLIGFWRMKLMM